MTYAQAPLTVGNGLPRGEIDAEAILQKPRKFMLGRRLRFALGWPARSPSVFFHAIVTCKIDTISLRSFSIPKIISHLPVSVGGAVGIDGHRNNLQPFTRIAGVKYLGQPSKWT
jgi:hypothetical protein